VLVNLGKGTRKVAFDHGRVAKALGEAGVGGVEADRLTLDQLGFDLAKGLAFFRVKGSHFQLALKTHKLTKLKKAGEVPEYRRSEDNRSQRKRDRYRGYRAKRDVSPDGKWRAYIHEYNVYVRTTEGDEKIQLSKDGKKDNAYQAPYWAPNSNNLIAYRIEPSKISEVHLLESSPKGGGKAKLHTRSYALPGDKFTSHELNWFDIEKKLPEKFVCHLRYQFAKPELTLGRPSFQIGHHMIGLEILEDEGHRIKLPDGPFFLEPKSDMALNKWIDLVIEYELGRVRIEVNDHGKTYVHEKVTMVNPKDKHGPRFTFKGGPDCQILFDSVRIWECN